jgi:hypothetical protein
MTEQIVFKNPIFEKNVTDPTNHKIVKSIYVHSWTKLARENWQMIWQYYRDRNRTSIEEVYKKYKDTQLQIIYRSSIKEIQLYIMLEKNNPNLNL